LPRLSALSRLSRLSLLGGLSGPAAGLPRLSGLPALPRLPAGLATLAGTLPAGLTALPARLPAVTVLSLVVAVPVARTHTSPIMLTGNKFSTSGEIGVRLGE
jgi:hypothetical protein